MEQKHKLLQPVPTDKSQVTLGDISIIDVVSLVLSFLSIIITYCDTTNIGGFVKRFNAVYGKAMGVSFTPKTMIIFTIVLWIVAVIMWILDIIVHKRHPWNTMVKPQYRTNNQSNN